MFALWSVVAVLIQLGSGEATVPEIPTQFQSDTSIVVNLPEELSSNPSHIFHSIFDARKLFPAEYSGSDVTVTGTYNYNYQIFRALFNFTQLSSIKHRIPIKTKKIDAYDIDNSFYINERTYHCEVSPNGGLINAKFVWTNATSGFPQRRVKYVNRTEIELPTGTVSCNLWNLKYLGSCGPTVPPPCAINVYLCSTDDNLPVLWKVVDPNSSGSISQYFWNVNVIPQPGEIFDIPETCEYYDYPSETPYGLEDGFEDGSVASFWIPCGDIYSRWECGHIYAQSDIVRSGKYAANITIEPGDISQPDGDESSTERDELDSRPWAIGERDIWYGMSFYLPEDFPITTDRLVMGQWKQNMAGDKHPLIAQRFVNNTWYYTVNVGLTDEKFYLRELELGVWHDFVYYLYFSPTSAGRFTAWHNNTKVIDYQGRTAYDYMPPYFYHKFGLYRDSWPTSWTIFFDNYAIGHSFQEVDPSRFD